MGNFVLKNLINNRKNNISEIKVPLDLLSDSSKAATGEPKMAVFLGANFRDLPGTDMKEVSRLSSLCLDYIRRECPDCNLYYKPHPAETDEASFLNLTDFTVTSKNVAELFYIENAKNIKYVFSACSGANTVAYAMGLNSYIFLNLFETALAPETMRGYREEYFRGLPETCYINDFNQPLIENKRQLINGEELRSNIAGIFSKKDENIWMLLGAPAFLTEVIALAVVIRKYWPDKKINLIINKHHRWEVIRTSVLDEYFDQVLLLPRTFYSLRPTKIWQAIKTALRIRRFPIKPEDIIFEFEGLSFMDNCFTSYFSSNMRIAMLHPDTFTNCFKERKLDPAIFRTRLGAKFFNLVLEPLLGLERSLWFEDGRRINNICGYTRPINDIFDYVWVFKS